MAVLTPVRTAFAGAGNATLATAITNFNTASTTAVTAAKAVTGVVPQTIQTGTPQLYFDGTLYQILGSVSYTTQV